MNVKMSVKIGNLPVTKLAETNLNFTKLKQSSMYTSIRTYFIYFHECMHILQWYHSQILTLIN